MIGIIGPKTTISKTKMLKDFLFNIKTNIGTHIKICSGGNEVGIEYDVKKYSLLFEFDYLEFNPGFTNCNMYSALNPSYYGRNYHGTLIYDRYIQMFRRIDKLIIALDGPSKFYEKLANDAIRNKVQVIFW